MKNLDQNISKKIYDATHKSPVFTSLATFGATYMIVIVVASAFWFAWNIPNDERHSVFPLFVMILLAWGITLALQFLIRRKRPFECLLYESKVKLFCKTPSFPSAHATIAFVIAGLMLHYAFAFFPLFLFSALWISLSRVAVGVHFVSDIVVGACIGLLVASIPFFAFYFLG